MYLGSGVKSRLVSIREASCQALELGHTKLPQNMAMEMPVVIFRLFASASVSIKKRQHLFQMNTVKIK